MAMKFDAGISSSVTTRVKVQNVMSVPLIFGISVAIVSLAIIILSPLKRFGAAMFIADFVFLIGIYIYWMFKDPERLQNEDYRIEHERLAAMQLTDESATQSPEVIMASLSNANAFPFQKPQAAGEKAGEA